LIIQARPVSEVGTQAEVAKGIRETNIGAALASATRSPGPSAI
jgi:hypothetical protein